MNGWKYEALSEAAKQATGERWNRWYAGWSWLTDPEFEGLEHVPENGPVLFVGNHSLMAFADAVLMLRELYRSKGIVCRSLGLHAHFKVPVWGKLLAANGAVDGTRENCSAMMQAGEHIIVYPGGGGEVMKRQGEQHTLRWKKRIGFARMAIENNCTVVPFSTVGADDCYDILYDNNRLSKTSIGRWLVSKGIKAEELPPLIKGLGPTLIPRPEKMYFRFHEPIHAANYFSSDMEASAWALRSEVERVVDGGISDLLLKRTKDKDRFFRRRLIKKIKLAIK